MRCATLWKSLAGVTGALALVLGSAGAAGAVTVAPAGARASTPSASESPTPDCHSAEHAGLGMVINCQSEHKG
jgi:hypothetical protein